MDVCRPAAGENTSCALTEELPAVDLLLFARQKKISIRSSPSLKVVVFRVQIISAGESFLGS